MEYEVGDEVKVVKKFGRYWVNTMDSTIGDEKIITSINRDHKDVLYMLEKWYYNQESLEPIYSLKFKFIYEL